MHHAVSGLVLQCEDTLAWDKVGSQRLDPKLDTEAQLHGSPPSPHITVLQSKGGFGVIEIGHQTCNLVQVQIVLLLLLLLLYV